MIPEEKIDPALQRIERLFVDQCAHGAQTQGLAADGAACGQFLAAKERQQRGLHGTAAALRVLAEASSDDASKLVPRLVWYVQNREALYRDGKERKAEKRTFEDDQRNVIKLSEILYALSFVKASQGQTDSLVQELAKKLLASRRENKGWAHFLDGTAPPDNLPTAFAVLALSLHGYDQDIKRQIEFLETNALDTSNNQASTITEGSVRIFCVFALAFRKENLAQEEIKRLAAAFNHLWKKHEALLDEDLEQNIEYWSDPANYYVRIPWQLYLFALAARLDPKRISSFAAQRRLNQILDAVLDKGFRYPYSGSSLSSRTNSIAFDALQKIKRFNKRNFLHKAYHTLDHVRTILGHPIVSWFTVSIVIALAGYCIYAWAASSGRPKDVGPDLTGAVVAMVVTFFIERLRKPR